MSGIQFLHSAVYLEQHKVLVFSDTHLGQEESYHRKGVLVPKVQFADLVSKLDDIFSRVEIHTVILNGDVKHEFGRIHTSEWREVRRLIQYFHKKKVEVILVEGNHDKALKHIAKEEGIELCYRYQVGNFLCIHGDKLEEDIPKDVDTLIMGHEHPAITLHQGMRTERFKCFLVGTYNKYNLLVLPSFTALTTGTNILHGRILSPYLKENLDTCEVYVPLEYIVEHFGTVAQLRELMEHND